jgi:hypothetical protein
MENIISLVGMSGVGKTYFSLSQHPREYFYYSVDYAIAKNYLKDKFFDDYKVRVDDLSPVSNFLGKFGSQKLGGLNRQEFLRRQKLYADAEIKATLRLQKITNKVFDLGYKYIINDLTGSICEIINLEIEDFLKQTTIKYFSASNEHINTLLERAKVSPKPLLFNEKFFTETIEKYKKDKNIVDDESIIPDDFCIYSFPLLLKYRIPKYEYISKL